MLVYITGVIEHNEWVIELCMMVIEPTEVLTTANRHWIAYSNKIWVDRTLALV